MEPNNPFETQGEPVGTPSPPPKKSKTWLWVFGIIGGLGVVLMMVCCGGGYYAMQMGTQVLADQVKEQIKNETVVKEQIGDIESVSFDFWETVADAQRQQNEGKQGNEKLVFAIEGSKGSGQIVGSQSPDGIGEMELVMSDGSRYPLEASLSPGSQEMGIDDFDPDDIDLGEAPALPEIPEQVAP